MRAIGVTEYGGPEALHEIDVPAEPLGEGQVRIRVHATAVSPTDTHVRAGTRSQADRAEDPGDVPGMDVAGVVAELGPGAPEDLSVGDRVMALVGPRGAHGAYREDIVVPGGSVVRTPERLSDAEASTIPMNGVTARMALDQMGLAPGQTLAVTGAAGTLGAYLVQLGKADGLHVIADAAEKDVEVVSSFGADQIVLRGDDVAQRIRELVPDGVDGLADASTQSELLLPAVKDGGTMATFRGFKDPGGRDVRMESTMVFTGIEDRERLTAVRDAAERGTITARVAEVLPASEAAEAHRRLEAGGLRGRIVLDLTA